MHRFFLPANECGGATLTLTGREAHHAAQVLRLRSGEPVAVLDGAGNIFSCKAQQVSRKAISLAVREKKWTPPPAAQITLVQAIPKGKIFESILQKATELGVTRMVPLLSERVTTQIDAESSETKVEKWRMTAIEAIKQCGQPWLPKVEEPISLQDFLNREEKFEMPLVASLHEGSRHPRDYLKKFLEDQKRKPRSACIWVGPEGDFTPQEMQQIIDRGIFPITLGGLVLRCETAAIYCLSVLNYELS
ncbi:MAG: RsmE family RNA methyltransferase [Verrucomicrobiota bacterium]